MKNATIGPPAEIEPSVNHVIQVGYTSGSISARGHIVAIAPR